MHSNGVLAAPCVAGIWHGRILLKRFCATVALLLLGLAAQAATTQYYYDDVGRIVQASGSDGSIRQYQYDANGNLLAINRISAGTLTISGLTPLIGHVGATVTILGAGFNQTPSQNEVRFGPIVATVSSATPTALVVTVPQGAQSGPVSVTTGGNTATSTSSYVVRKPSINSFSPTFVNPGAAITVLGTNMNLMPGSAAFTVGNVAATLSSISHSKGVFAAPNASGLVTINTPYGQASSTTALTVVPPEIGTANVIPSGQLTANGAPVAVSITQPNKSVVMPIQASVGDLYTLRLTALTVIPNWSSVLYTVYRPNNTVFISGATSGTGATVYIELPQIAQAGTYLVTFTPAQTTSSVQMNVALALSPTLTPSAAPVNVSTVVPGVSQRFSFVATAGQSFGLGLTNLVTDAAVGIEVKRLDGTTVGGRNCFTNFTPGCQLSLRDLAAGYYSVNLVPWSGTMSFALTFSQNVSGVLTPGTALNVNLAAPGQNASLTFNTSGGENLAVNLSGVVITPAFNFITMSVYDGSGTQLATTSTNAATINFRNLAAGTYSVHLVPQNAATATMQVTLAATSTPSLPQTGVTTNFSTSLPGQERYFTFNATAGQNLGLALTSLVVNPADASTGLYVELPNGNPLTAESCWPHMVPGCQIILRNLPVSGAYRVRVAISSQSTMSFGLTLSQSLGGTLSPNAPIDLNLAANGQNAVLTFAAAAGQNVALSLRSVTSAPPDRPVLITIYDSGGTQINSAWINFGVGTVNLPNLAAGTYTAVLMVDKAATATMQLTMAAEGTAALPLNGSSNNFSTSVFGQSRYFTFTATAGQSVDLALTNLVLTPAGGNVGIGVFQPNGWTAASAVCFPSTVPGCTLNVPNVPLTGTYTVRVDTGAQLASFTLTLSLSFTATPTLDVPVNINLSAAGQTAVLTFTATQGQTLALGVSTIATQPAGKFVNVNVIRPDGGSAGSGSDYGTGSLTINLPNMMAGTHKIFITPADAATATMQVTLASGLTGTLTPNGVGSSFAGTIPGQYGYIKFDATAGQHLSLALTDMVLTPAGQASLQVVQPNGFILAGDTCYSSVPPGCNVSLFNLPLTGTYWAVIQPNVQTAMSFTLTLSQAVTGTLTLGTPQPVSLALPGQAAVLSFTATAGQSVNVGVSSIATTPSGKAITLTAYWPDRTYLTSTGSTTAISLNLNNLPAGTYSIVLTPQYAATGSMQVTVQ